MEFINKLVWVIFHLSPKSLNDFLTYVGPGKLYVILFVIVFAETGLVVTPFLPGDSLLFALGAVGAAPDSPLNLPLVTGLLIVAAVLGDAVNYWMGYKLGPAVFRREDSRLLNKKHLIRAQEFYEKYGGKTIILARFVPIVRTFAPFVAGVGRMNFFKFWAYNIVGGVAWVMSMTLAGYILGSIVPDIESRIHIVVAVVIGLSLLPPAYAWFKSYMGRASKPAIPPATDC